MQRPSARTKSFALGMLMLLPHGRPACAQETPATASAGQEQAPPQGLFEQETLTGDWDGFRSDLKDQGIAVGATETGELLGAIDGPRRGGAIVEGRLELDLDLDLERIADLRDTVVHANAYQIHGRGLSQNYLGANLLTASNIEATRATRLFDLWLQKGFLADALSIRAGQIAADDEFITSQYASIFVNATFGWPALTSTNLPSGGPAYPLATPGVRVKAAFTDELSIQAALFSGDPAGEPAAANPQRADAGGTNFSLSGGGFMIAEGAYVPQIEGGSQNWPTAYKVGGWYHTGTFADQRYDLSGLPLADPASSGLARRHRGSGGVYAVADQPLYRMGDSEDRGIAAFLRVGFAPGNQSLVSAYFDTGINWKGVLDSRQDDMLALAFGCAQLSGSVQGYDRDLRRFQQPHGRIGDFEGVVELSYQVALAPWWSVQPDLQYIVHPTPTDGSRTSAPGAAILGMRTSVKF